MYAATDDWGVDTIHEKVRAFDRRWKVLESLDEEQEFERFKIRVLNVFDDVQEHTAVEDDVNFCNVLGVRHSDMAIFRTLRDAQSSLDLCRVLQVLAYLSYENSQARVYYVNKIQEIIEMSAIDVSVTRNGMELILYPRGEKKLDEVLVEQTLSFLNPASEKHFLEALKQYEKSTPAAAVKSAESLRRALEEFLRHKFGNKVGLKGNLKNLQTRLKEGSGEAQVRNIISQTASYLDQYFNDNSKHADGDIGEPENEFLIYQVGLLARYIDKVIEVDEVPAE